MLSEAHLSGAESLPWANPKVTCIWEADVRR
jgi:hypothetical protein